MERWPDTRSTAATRAAGVLIPDDAAALRASTDGRFLFLGTFGVPARLDGFDLATGRRIAWKTLLPEDPAGVVFVGRIAVTPDGAAYAYRYLRFLQNLYVFGGPPRSAPAHDPQG